MRSFPLSLLLGLVSLSAVGCHSALDEAMDSYVDARYPTAAAQFRAVEPATRTLSQKDFASYALYRGLTHLALGDAQAALRWVGYAKQCADRDPLVFSDQERGALIAAWRSMGYLPGERAQTGQLELARQTGATGATVQKGSDVSE